METMVSKVSKGKKVKMRKKLSKIDKRTVYRKTILEYSEFLKSGTHVVS